MIRLEKVCFAYEKEIALRYVDLHIEKGDSLVIQGPNGCGKSTLMELFSRPRDIIFIKIMKLQKRR